MCESHIELGLMAFEGLLGEYRKGNYLEKSAELEGVGRHLKALSESWDQGYPGFPAGRFPYASLGGVLRRGVRDKYLKDVIVKVLEADAHGAENRTLVNPVCVFGRHTRHLAARLDQYQTIGTDISATSDWLYRHLPFTCPVQNYEFRPDNVFAPTIEVKPTAVVFFGACGSLSDAAMDYAIESESPHLFCRTCCHENIGGNTEIAKQPTPMNVMFRLKNAIFSVIRSRSKDHYFSARYSAAQYPRSALARELTDSPELLAIASHSVDSDICRSIIDLDRFLHLGEKGYRVWYKGELFVARKMTANRHER
ncbi:hypothetical protein ACFL34_01545 [Candidatus Sumerlaeota bacterium]